ncbi:MAG: NACHT domain-containing protein [Candidatus Aminicenantes bacterium]|nr:MAG: NACHT domain-containing protein [Candidatus Aminicenantes bacterium]
MNNNKGYIITVSEKIAGEGVLLELASSKPYIKSLNCPVIIYKDRNQLEEIETGVRPAFRMNGFIILNFNADDREKICSRVKDMLKNDEFIGKTLKENETIREERINFNDIKALISKVNEIITKRGMKLTKTNILNILKISIETMPGESPLPPKSLPEVPEPYFITNYREAAESYKEHYQKHEMLNTFIELCALDSANKPEGRLIKAVDEAVKSGRPIAIIGEFGAGKTTFTRYYEYKKKCEWLKNPHNSRLVLFLDLNEYSRDKYTLSIMKWVLINIKKKINVDIKSGEFEEFLNEKKMLLIFDGLDEVANIPGEDAINKSVRKIKNISQKGSPVIITSRKAFLESEVNHKNLKDFKLLYIDDLNIQQIIDFVREKIPDDWRSFIESVFGKKERADLYRIFEQNTGDNNVLPGLIRKPLFLDMMISAYQRNHLEKIENQADLYEVLTKDWISQESEKEGTSLMEEDMRQIIEELAYKMFDDNQFSYTAQEFKELIKKIFAELRTPLNQNYNPKSVMEDMTNVSFLIRDKKKKNNFAFKHRSFVEYFTAHKLASELKERNTDNFSKRILYEEIFEFLACIMTEKSGRDEDLTTILGSTKFPFEARVNVIPPLRKQRNEKAIKPLLNTHTDIELSHPLLRFVCGYTLEIFQRKFPGNFKSQEFKDRLIKAYQKEKNSLIRLRMALLLTEGKYNQFEFKELNPDYEFSSSSLEEILEATGIIEAYEKVLKVNREHPILLEESIRILTVHVSYNAGAWKFRDTLLRYIFKFGYNHKNERVQRISLWSMDKLGLFKLEDTKRETLKIRTRAARIVVRSFKGKSSIVQEIAKNIVAKYPDYFFSHFTNKSSK